MLSSFISWRRDWLKDYAKLLYMEIILDTSKAQIKSVNDTIMLHNTYSLRQYIYVWLTGIDEIKFWISKTHQVLTFLT